MSNLLCKNPFSEGGYIQRLTSNFGARYVFFIAFIYGVNQGIGYSFGNTAKNYWFQDTVEEGGVELSPTDSQKVSTFSRIPWQIKSIFGILSDAFAINYFHRKWYLSIAAFLGAIGWFMLGVGPTPGTWALIFYLMSTNLAVAFPDVLIDGSVAEKCQKYPRYAVDLQSMLWGALGVGGMISSGAAGFVYEAIGSKPMFVIVSAVPLTVGALGLLNWIDDKPDYDAPAKRAKFFKVLFRAIFGGNKDASQKVSGLDDVEPAEKEVVFANGRRMGEGELDTITGRLYILAAILCAVAIAVGTIGNSLEDSQVTEWMLVWICSVCIVCVSLWVFTRGISKGLATTAIYIFLKGAVQPYNYLMYYWQRTKTANCCGVGYSNANVSAYPAYCTDSTSGAFLDYDYDFGEKEDMRPCLSDAYLSYSSIGAYFFLTVGVIVYNRYLSYMSYRKIWTLSAIAFFCISWLDFIWINRINIKIGIPDEWFAFFGGEVIATVIDRFDSMPFFVLAAKLCPPGVEGTLFAMLMGLSNFGSDMGGYLGTVLEQQLEVVYPDYTGLNTYIIIQNAFKIIPIFLVPILVPTGGPLDPSEYYEGSEEEAVEAQEEALLGAGSREPVAQIGNRVSVRK